MFSVGKVAEQSMQDIPSIDAQGYHAIRECFGPWVSMISHTYEKMRGEWGQRRVRKVKRKACLINR